MLTEYKSFLLCSSSLSHSSSFNSCSSNTTTSNDGNKTHSNKNNSSKYKNKNFYQTFEELKKANNLFFYLYLTISIHGYNENKYYFKTEIAKVNFYDINYWYVTKYLKYIIQKEKINKIIKTLIIIINMCIFIYLFIYIFIVYFILFL